MYLHFAYPVLAELRTRDIFPAVKDELTGATGLSSQLPARGEKRRGRQL